jgi:hypothetical protein
LGDEYGTKIVLASFLDPGDVGFCTDCLFIQDGLRFFHHGQSRNGFWKSRCKLLLVMVKDAA